MDTSDICAMVDDSDGQCLGGVVTHTHTDTHTTAAGASTYTGELNEIDNSYSWWDQAQVHKTESAFTGTTTGSSTSTYHYDPAGRNTFVHIVDARAHDVYFETDSTGAVLKRWETSSASGNPVNKYMLFDGHQIGAVSNNGGGPQTMTFTSALADRNVVRPADPLWSNATGTGTGTGSSQPYADFDQSYQPINPNSMGSSNGSQVTVHQGDTLRTLAAAMWGDANLWYVIAQANSLTGSETLQAGQSGEGHVWTAPGLQGESDGLSVVLGRVLTCVRPRLRRSKCRGPVWSSRTRSNSRTRA